VASRIPADGMMLLLQLQRPSRQRIRLLVSKLIQAEAEALSRARLLLGVGGCRRPKVLLEAPGTLVEARRMQITHGDRSVLQGGLEIKFGVSVV
jgi:hypothetical protein